MGLLRFDRLAAVEGLQHGISTRAVPRETLGEHLGAPATVLTAHQVHGSRIFALDDATPERPGQGDGLSTSVAGGPLLGVLGADCPGVLLVAPEAHALAVLHAGWRGVVAGIVPAGVHLLRARYGAAPEDLLVGIGPGIGVDRYEVSTEVADALAGSVRSDARDRVVRPGRPGHAQADLRAAIRAQLVERGVPDASIETHPACTYDDERFFSYRREGPETGRHLLVARWR